MLFEKAPGLRFYIGDFFFFNFSYYNYLKTIQKRHGKASQTRCRPRLASPYPASYAAPREKASATQRQATAQCENHAENQQTMDIG